METVFTFSRHERKNIMKKIIATFLLLLTITAPLFGCDHSDISEASDSQNASDSISDTSNGGIAADFEYSVIRDGTISIDKYIGNAAEVVIPDTIDGKNVTEIGKEAFRSADVTSVVMPQYLRTIRYYAFYDCTKLSQVILNDKVDLFETDVFMNTNIKHIRIPAKAFSGECVDIFKGTALESVELAEGIERIPAGAFQWCLSLKRVELPSTVKVIEAKAFAVCMNLEEVKLNDGLYCIENKAFESCSKLKKLVIPKSVRYMTSQSVFGSGGLEGIYFEGDAPETFIYTDDTDSIFYIDPADVSYTIYYHKGAKGFTSPTWYDYPTQIIE